MNEIAGNVEAIERDETVELTASESRNSIVRQSENAELGESAKRTRVEPFDDVTSERQLDQVSICTERATTNYCNLPVYWIHS